MSNIPGRKWLSGFKSFLDKITPDTIYQPDDGLNYWREQIFMRIIIVVVIGSTMVVGLMAMLSIQIQYWSILLVDLLAYTTAFIAAFSKRIKLRTRIHLFMIIIFSLGLSLQIIGGPIGNGIIILFVFPIMAAILLGLGEAAIALGMNLIATIVLGILLHTGTLENTGMAQYTMVDWIGSSIGFLFFNALVTFSLSTLLTGLNHSFKRIQETQTALQESQERYQAIIEDQIELVDRWQPDGTLTFVNQAVADYTGIPREELIGKNLFSFLTEEHQAYLKERIKTLTPADPVVTLEEAVVIKGRTNWMRWTNRALFNEKGEIQEFQSVGSDITERKRAEENLERSETRYRAIVESQHEIISRWRPDTTLTFINDAGCRFYDKTREELMQTSIIDLAPQDEKQKLRDYIASFTVENPVQTIQLFGPDKDGNIHWFEWCDNALIEKGHIVEFQSVGRDITEEKRIRDELLTSEARYRAVIEDQVELIGRVAPDGRITFFNHAFARFYGLNPEENFNGSVFDLIETEDAAKLIEEFNQLSPENPVQSNTYQETNVNGENRWYTWTNRGIFDGHGKLTEIQVIGQDVHEQKLAEQALQESEARYRAVVEDQMELIDRILPDTTMTFCNEAYARFFGKKPVDLIGCKLATLLNPEEAAHIQKIISEFTPKNPVAITSHIQVNHRGERRWFRWTDRGIFDEKGNLIEVQGIGEDIHERKLAEQALQESEARYRAIVQNQVEPVCRWRPDCTLTFVNDAYCKLFDKTREELLGESFKLVVPDEDWMIVEQMILDLKTGASSAVDENRVFTANGIRWLQWAVSAIKAEDGTILEFQSVGHDTSEQKYTQQMLEQTLSDQIKLSKANSELAERLEGLYLTDVNRHEIQLRHLASELHDDVLNALAVVSANIDLEEIPHHVSQAYEQAIQRTREIVSGLRTAMLNYGLYIGLETLADELADQLPDGPLLYVDIPHSVIRYDPDVELHLFRIAQEACSNAIKHANATEIHIRGELDMEMVLLEISDNGSGFDTDEILDLPDLLRKEHFGLAGMFERAELIHGELSINAAPHKGSCVRVVWHAMQECAA